MLLSARQFSFLRQKFKTQKQKQSKYIFEKKSREIVVRKNIIENCKESKRTAWLLHIRGAWCYDQSITAQEKLKFDQYHVACQNLPWIFIFEIIKLHIHICIYSCNFSRFSTCSLTYIKLILFLLK